MRQTLLQKVWDKHAVRKLPTGQTQLFIGLHLIHEVTSPQAFDMLRMRGSKVAFPNRTFATVDHIVPTPNQSRPFLDVLAEEMMSALEKNCREFGIPLYDITSANQGIVHVIGPELGLTQPGMTIACGDSHTSTHGAFGSVAFGIGTSQVRDVLASGCLAMEPLKVRRIVVNGRVPHGVYVNPDNTTFEYLRGRPFAPAGKDFDEAVRGWSAMASDADARFDDEVTIDANSLEPTVTWGINPGQSIGIGGRIPTASEVGPSEQAGVAEALAFMGFEGGAPIAGTPIDVAFVGSCTNSRLSDLREAARVVAGGRVAPHVRALVVPGSERVRRAAEHEGLHEVFQAAGFEWRGAGCSMCLAMNPDRLNGREICASSSNRNFKGRQGSPTGRTLLMSPAMVAAAAIAGEVVDVRQVLSREEVGA